ncbi:MAG: ion transporter [Hyphomonadaceae bacterium]|nr:ion transporter [Hyphomonadaceae bacterium]GIK47836.1 MAG: ion transporter [Alphaproteobacteria bacterium]
MKRDRLRSLIRALYFGHTQAALRFQGVLLALDLLIIGFFIGSQFIRGLSWFWIVDAAIACFIAVDLFARLFAVGTLRRWLKYPTTWIDLVVLATLLFPAVLYNWGFLRILRLWTLVHSERFWNVLARGKWDDTYVEDLARAVVTLAVFVFLAAGVTQAFFLGAHPKLNNFIDAMYFVVTSLTTTGYGDITLDSAGGRLFSIGLMIAGISLFFSIAQKAFAPQRKIQRCAACGQDRHGLDAKFCSNCGTELTAPLRGRARIARGTRGKGG